MEPRARQRNPGMGASLCGPGKVSPPPWALPSFPAYQLLITVPAPPSLCQGFVGSVAAESYRLSIDAAVLPTPRGDGSATWMLKFTATAKLAESSGGWLSLRLGFCWVSGPNRGACPRRALYVEACRLYCLLYIIYLVLIYNCMIARGS